MGFRVLILDLGRLGLGEVKKKVEMDFSFLVIAICSNHLDDDCRSLKGTLITPAETVCLPALKAQPYSPHRQACCARRA